MNIKITNIMIIMVMLLQKANMKDYVAQKHQNAKLKMVNTMMP